MPMFIEGKRVQAEDFYEKQHPQAPGRDVEHTAIQEKISPTPTEDLVFQKKFAQMRPALLQTLRNASVIQDHDQVLTAFASHLQEISPKHKCPRWEIIRAAAGWHIFLKTFIADRQKLDDAIWSTDPYVIEVVALLQEERIKRYAACEQEKKEKAREKELARRGFHSS
jgi:hypothetical protein